jgi:hypothetical protein
LEFSSTPIYPQGDSSKLLPVVNKVDRSETGDVLNIVIVYKDPAAAVRAMHALDGSAGQFEGTIEFHRQLWRFDFLGEPRWRSQAMMDVLKADLLLISAGSEGDLPDWFQTWLCDCLSQMRDTTGAVVALLKDVERPDAPAVGRLLSLREAAREAGWDFISSPPVNEPAVTHPPAERDLLLEAVRKSSRKDYQSARPMTGGRVPLSPADLNRVTPHYRWGINE